MNQTLDEARSRSLDEALGLVGLPHPERVLACLCSCHGRRFGLPTDELHEGGATCSCQQSPEERAGAWDAFFAETEAWWGSPEGRAAAAAEEAEEGAAYELGARLGLTFTIASRWVPVILEGRMHGEHGFWFRARGGVWRLHRDDHEGEVIASGAGEPELQGAVRLVAEHLGADVLRRGCAHAHARMFCPECGVRVAPLS